MLQITKNYIALGRILSFLLYPQRQKTFAIIITLRNRNVRNEMELTGNVLLKTWIFYLAFGKIQSGAPTSHSGAHVRRSQLIFLFQAVNLCFSTVSGYYSKICLLNEFIFTKGKQKLTQLNKRNWDIYYTDLTCRYIWIN